MNVVALVGRLVRDPELKYTQNQQPVVRFTIAVDRQFKKEGQPTADFIGITAWGKLAENINNFMRKGRLVSASGRIQTRSWDEDGKKRYATDVVADSVQFLDRAKDQANEDYQGTGFQPVEGEDDLPF